MCIRANSKYLQVFQASPPGAECTPALGDIRVVFVIPEGRRRRENTYDLDVYIHEEREPVCALIILFQRITLEERRIFHMGEGCGA